MFFQFAQIKTEIFVAFRGQYEVPLV